jgi:hypothetical protein
MCPSPQRPEGCVLFYRVQKDLRIRSSEGREDVCWFTEPRKSLVGCKVVSVLLTGSRMMSPNQCVDSRRMYSSTVA